MNYFEGFTTVAEIKKQYRKLCSIHHPDKGGNTETMQELNIQYKAALASADGQVSEGADGKEHTYRYNEATEQEIIDKINELLALNLSDVEIALIGTWIWITGNTKPVKDLLKQAKCKWHSKRKCWFFSTQKKTRYNKRASLSDLAETYGCSVFTESKKQLN